MRLCDSDSWFFITKSESSDEYAAEMRPASRMFSGSHPGNAAPELIIRHQRFSGPARFALC
jgi:hypothetical protein